MERLYNYTRPKSTRTVEKNNGVSQTIPDQTLSITEIMQRHSRGLAIDQRVPNYNTPEEIETSDGRDIRTMDISEVHSEMQEINERIKQREQDQEKARKQKQIEDSARREQEQREKWRQEFINEQNQKSQTTNK